MVLQCNRFSVFPKMCDCCKRYIWFEPYRRADVYEHILGIFIEKNICKRCLPRYLPSLKKKEV